MFCDVLGLRINGRNPHLIIICGFGVFWTDEQFACTFCILVHYYQTEWKWIRCVCICRKCCFWERKLFLVWFYRVWFFFFSFFLFLSSLFSFFFFLLFFWQLNHCSHSNLFSDSAKKNLVCGKRWWKQDYLTDKDDTFPRQSRVKKRSFMTSENIPLLS